MRTDTDTVGERMAWIHRALTLGRFEPVMRRVGLLVCHGLLPRTVGPSSQKASKYGVDDDAEHRRLERSHEP